MGQPYVGQLLCVGFNFAPVGWAVCAGQTVPISENETLFNLIGTTYGGDGQSTFNLPDLRGRTPIHMGTLAGGSTYVIGQPGGVESVTVNINQYPRHNHAFLASDNAANNVNPGSNTVGRNINIYGVDTPASAMNANMIGSSGGGNQPHQNMQPFQVLNWIIALYGVYPTQS